MPFEAIVRRESLRVLALANLLPSALVAKTSLTKGVSRLIRNGIWRRGRREREKNRSRVRDFYRGGERRPLEGEVCFGFRTTFGFREQREKECRARKPGRASRRVVTNSVCMRRCLRKRTLHIGTRPEQPQRSNAIPSICMRYMPSFPDAQ